MQTQTGSDSASTSSRELRSRPLTLVKTHHGTSRKPVLRLGLPIWLCGKVWELYTAQSQTEWAFRLRTYNVIPHDSPIFRHARSGDVDALKDILQRRRGSVFDRNDEGETALHVRRGKPFLTVESRLTPQIICLDRCIFV
jgi:hypothetical protein